MRKGYKYLEYDSHMELDLRQELKKRLKLNIVSAKVFDKVIETFEEGDINKINSLIK